MQNNYTYLNEMYYPYILFIRQSDYIRPKLALLIKENILFQNLVSS
jgi:hypothetical protein